MNTISKALLIILPIVLSMALVTACDEDGGDDDDLDADDDGDDDDDFFDDDDDDDDDEADDDDDDDDDDTADDDTGDDDTADDDTGDDDTTVGFEEDFEDHSLGPLNDPNWVILEQSGASLAEIIALTDKAEGQALHVGAGSAINDQIVLKYFFYSIMEDYTVQFDLKALLSTYTSLTLYQKNGLHLYPEFGIELDPTDDTLHASMGGFVQAVGCDLYDPGEWNEITLVIDWANAQYTVLFDGVEDPFCNDLGFAIGDGMPLAALIIADPPEAGYGGDAYYDNFIGQPFVP